MQAQMMAFTILIKAASSKERGKSSFELHELLECATCVFIGMLAGNPRFLIKYDFKIWLMGLGLYNNEPKFIL